MTKPPRLLCVLSVIVFAVLALGQVLTAAPQDLSGHWAGAIAVPGTKLEVDLDFLKQPDGTWTGDISIPAQGAKDLPLAGIKAEGADVTFAISGVPGDPTFKGRISADGAKITGQF
ncbi:MAG: serine hydrolase, partial [Candidatus Aminicenantes bacterium RBG_16_66_30]